MKISIFALNLQVADTPVCIHHYKQLSTVTINLLENAIGIQTYVQIQYLFRGQGSLTHTPVQYTQPPAIGSLYSVTGSATWKEIAPPALTLFNWKLSYLVTPGCETMVYLIMVYLSTFSGTGRRCWLMCTFEATH